MNKLDLVKFVELYNLGEIVERVKLESDGTNLKTGIVTDDRTLAGNITYKGLALEKGEYGIHDTKQLKKMLSILDATIEVSVLKDDAARAIGLNFSDKNAESLVMLADLSVIPNTPVLKNAGTFDLEILIDDDFIDRYIRAKNALSDVTTFTFLLNKKTDKVELVIGHSNINTNRIKLEINTVPGKDKPEKIISFNADYLKNILDKNRGVTGTVFKVNTAGLGHLHFKTDQYEANYYLLKAITT